MTGRQPRRRARTARSTPTHPLTLPALVVLLLISILAATVPGSGAAFTASITNTNNTVGTAATATYFTCVEAVTASAPTIWYRLNETLGTTAVDSSGGGRNGTYRGLPVFGAIRACPRDTGTAVTFNGSTDYAGYGTALTVTGTYTIETWFKTTTTRGGRLVGFGASATGVSRTTDRQLYMTDSGQVVYGINPPSYKIITSPSSYNDGAWHHAMATQSSAGMNLYLDGTLVATAGTTTNSSTYSGFFRLGYDSLTGWTSAPTSSFFAGTLDDVAYYTKALTATDATDHYAAGS